MDDKRLAPGALVVVDDDLLAGRAFQRVGQALGGKYDVLRATSLEELERVMIPRRRRIAGRMRVRGFYIDWFLDRSGAVLALDALAWLDQTYPRTPVFLFSGSEDVERIARDCVGRGYEFVLQGDVGDRWAFGSDALRDAVLGLVFVRSRPVPLVRRLALDLALMRHCERTFFRPWDARCVAIRRWLLDAAGHNVIDVGEQHLRTLDAYFESVPAGELHRARGVLRGTMAQIVSEIRALWQVEDLDVLKHRWERVQGRGAILVQQGWRAVEREVRRPAARRAR